MPTDNPATRPRRSQRIHDAYQTVLGRDPTAEELKRHLRSGLDPYAIRDRLRKNVARAKNKILVIAPPQHPSTTTATPTAPIPATFLAPNTQKDPSGVLFRTHWQLRAVGLCDAYRRLARSLVLAGGRVKVEGFKTDQPYPPWYSTTPSKEAIEEVGSLLSTRITEAARINAFAFFVGGSTTKQFLASACLTDKERLLGIGDQTVYYTMTEMYKVWIPELVPLLNRCTELWVPCKANIECFARSGIEREKLIRIPVPYFDNDPRAALVGRSRDPGVPRMYHIGNWEPRKDQEILLKCFLLALRPSQAHLRIKTHPASGPGASVIKDRLLQDRFIRDRGWNQKTFQENVEIIASDWSETEITNLHAWGDIYLCASHGEGWNMPARDAKLAGNRMVHVASGGSEDFAGEYDFTIPINGWIPSPYPGVIWASYDSTLVQKAIIEVVEDFKPIHERDVDLTEQKAAVVGKQMLNRLRALGARI